MKNGDTVQLKKPQQGRRFKGKIIKISGGIIRVMVFNGLYVEYPKKCWETVREEEGNED